MKSWRDYGFPPVIADRLGEESYQTDSIGRSDAAVLLFSDKVLKIGKTSAVSDYEYAVLKWIDGRLRAPRILSFVRANGFNYLLMTRLSGEMACETKMSPEEVAEDLARGIRVLRSVDITDCPQTRGFREALAEARMRLIGGELDGLRPQTEEFSDFESLYEYLSTNIPEETLVFSHGDYCLPNVFLSDEGIGFLDLGSAGVMDKDYDVFMCLWSMRYNFVTIGGMDEVRFEKCRQIFFETLGETENREKIRFHRLLDEFFI